MLMPCFRPDQGFVEGIILGRLFAGYGEIELQMCRCLIVLEKWDYDGPIRNVFGERNAETRIKIVKKALRTEYGAAGFRPVMAEVFSDMDYCRKIRNQYAHCQWGWDNKKNKLFFVNLEDLAKLSPSQKITKLMANERRLDVPLLSTQEAFFLYVKESFYHLESAYTGWQAQKKAPKRTSYVFPRPQKVARPPLHY